MKVCYKQLFFPYFPLFSTCSAFFHREHFYEICRLTVCMPISTYLHFFEVNEFLSRIEWWSLVNGFIINPSKYQDFKFRLRYEKHPNTLLESHNACTDRDSLINTVSKVNCLVVSFSSDLSRSRHILLLSTSDFRLTICF